ncbi:MAG TPA: hypothetical protein VKA84_24710 [Gemmatimonadaceae bacterium]|nr:hypothetical protein [Gemmatimonadaceae bacterium]
MMRARAGRRAVIAAVLATSLAASTGAAQTPAWTRHPAGIAFQMGSSIAAIRVWKREPISRSSSGVGGGVHFRLVLYPVRGVGVGAQLRQEGGSRASGAGDYNFGITLLAQYHAAAVGGVRHAYVQASAGSMTASSGHPGVDGRVGALAIGASHVYAIGSGHFPPELAAELEALRLFPQERGSDKRLAQVSLTGLGGVTGRF